MQADRDINVLIKSVLHESRRACARGSNYETHAATSIPLQNLDSRCRTFVSGLVKVELH